jgi:hypothetical protein
MVVVVYLVHAQSDISEGMSYLEQAILKKKILEDSFLLGCYVISNEQLWQFERNKVPTQYYKLTLSSFSLYDSEKLSPPILRLLMN